MANLSISISCGTYDRTVPLLDGRIKAEGIDITWVPTLRPGSPMGSTSADVYEASITSAIMQANGEATHAPIAVCPRRKFTHQLLITRRDTKITSLADLSGKRIGIFRWYEHPLAVWLRGHLSDQCNIAATQIHWFTEKEDRFPINRLGAVKLSLSREGKTLVEMLSEGEIDVLAHEEAHLILAHHPALTRVFPQFVEAEANYFAAAKIFPSYHALVIRKSLAARHPWVAASLVKAFTEAKEVAMHTLERDSASVSMPWVADLLRRQQTILARDLYPYGLESTQSELETLIRYLHEQELLPVRRSVDEIFVSDVYQRCIDV